MIKDENGKWKHTEEELRKISNQTKLAMNTPEAKANLLLIMHTGDYNERMSKGVRLSWQRKEVREKHIVGLCKPEYLEFLRKKMLGSNNYNWQGGIGSLPYAPEWNESLKRQVRERDNYICQACYKIGKHVHHIDYNKLNCEETNLITTCVSCNGKANFNKEYWQSFFTQIINKKYLITKHNNSIP